MTLSDVAPDIYHKLQQDYIFFIYIYLHLPNTFLTKSCKCCLSVSSRLGLSISQSVRTKHCENSRAGFQDTDLLKHIYTEPRRDEVTGEWRKLHNEELNGLYSSPNIVRVIKSRRMRLAEHVARMGEERGAYGVLVGKPEGKRPLGRPRRRWVDNIRMDLQEVGCGHVDWIGLAQDRDGWRKLVNAVMNLRVP